MGIFRRENLFCILCKKSITHKQKPKREWNLEGFLCGDCYVDKMKEQYNIKNEIIGDSKEIQTNKVVKSSPKSIKIRYYLTIFIIIGSSLMTINGLIAVDIISVTIGVIFLIINLIQFPKSKKEFDGLSKNEDTDLPKNKDTPMTMLKERYAKGEITKEEFNKIKEDLKD